MEPWQTIMLVGGIAVVCAAVLPRRAGNGKQDQSLQPTRNMETALEQFMENMEADNRDIASLVAKSAQEAQAQALKRDDRLEQLEKRNAALERALTEQAERLTAIDAALVAAQMAAAAAAASTVNRNAFSNTGVAYSAASDRTTDYNRAAANQLLARQQPQAQLEAELPAEEPAEEAEASSIRNRYADLFEMYQAGKSIDAIAKKLGRNKGEIQLILQLSKQEEAARHE